MPLTPDSKLAVHRWHVLPRALLFTPTMCWDEFKWRDGSPFEGAAGLAEGEGDVCSVGNGKDRLRTLGALRARRVRWEPGEKGPSRGVGKRRLLT